jgi:radical SAM-linked protein
MDSKTGKRSGEAPRQAMRLALGFAIDGDLRSLSHHDTIRMWTRAIRRAGLPLAYSQGFNPLPKISLPLPRPVGVASDAELAVVGMGEVVDADSAAERLNGVFPPGCRIHRAAVLPARMSPQPDSATYEALLDEALLAGLEARIARTLSLTEIETERDGGPARRSRKIEIRPFIETIELSGKTLAVRTRVTESGTVRVDEWLGVLGLDPAAVLHRVRRVHVEWKQNIWAPDATPESHE